ncbi:TlpA disulfide reductase family protein [Tenacibaculum maritimum]|nr:TlpA disulfide reductase family protein [Tenacibaculum maritimum]MDB0602521.1 TlpA disulfide reductase family protein [Tenacibaculum maritimum]MDB0613766.1 TlpA disulfide reductase family protein [Tenacibaculum maritimum]
MKNILPAILSIVVSFTAITIGISLYKNKSTTVNDRTKNTVKKNNKTKSSTSEKVAPAIRKTAVTPSVAKDTSTDEEGNLTPNVVVTDAQKSYEAWKTYYKENIDLMSTFTPLDNIGSKMNKGTFLSLLRTGAYIPIKLKGSNKRHYQLFNLSKTSDEKIAKEVKAAATIARLYYKMEGKKLPEYNFIDLDGVAYNKADTKGKILVLKCWFINCKICVEEFPELNKLVDRYKDNKNITFVSLAFDKGNKLKAFLEKKAFKYAVIPEQKKYMSKKLKIKQYPTHIIVDSNGTILKMVNNVYSLMNELDMITKEKTT